MYSSQSVPRKLDRTTENYAVTTVKRRYKGRHIVQPTHTEAREPPYGSMVWKHELAFDKIPNDHARCPPRVPTDGEGETTAD
jgi:hypothetical protein